MPRIRTLTATATMMLALLGACASPPPSSLEAIALARLA